MPIVQPGMILVPVDAGNDIGHSMWIQPDGKILMGGWSFDGTNDDFSVVRLNADGTLDTSFNGTGKVLVPVGSSDDEGYALLLQPDGKIVVAGQSSNGGGDDFSVVRLNPDGSLDTSFNGSGTEILPTGWGDQGVGCAVLQADGKIVLAGYDTNGSQTLVARLNADGSLDTSFYGGGLFSLPMGNPVSNAFGATVDLHGRILIAGYSGYGPNRDYSVARLNPDGSLDTSFGSDGISIFNVSNDNVAYSIKTQSDGKIVVAGFSYGAAPGSEYDFSLARLNADGSLDTTFNGSGTLVVPVGFSSDYGSSIVVQPDGSIVVGGNVQDPNGTFHFGVVRVTADGALDTTFNGTGELVLDFGSGNAFDFSLQLQADGKIVAGGYASNGSDYDMAFARINPDGSLDTTFGVPSPVNHAPTFAPPEIGKVVTDFGGNEIGRALAVLADGSFLVAGDANAGGASDFVIAHYMADGSLDTGFGSGGEVRTDLRGGSNDIARSIVTQPDGKFIVCGDCKLGTSRDFAVVRYNADGSLDTTWGGTGTIVTDVGSNSKDIAWSVQLQTDGRVVVTGGSGSSVAVVRYDTDGSLDTSWGGTGKVTTPISGSFAEQYDSTIQPDGRIVVGGVSGTDFALLRYNTDGTLDTAFGGTGIVLTDVGTPAEFRAITLQSDGKIVAAGNLVHDDFSPTGDIALVRYNADGTLDTSFGSGGMVATNVIAGVDPTAIGYVWKVTTQPDGKILVSAEEDGVSADNACDFLLVRYNTDGSLDTTWGGTGIVRTDIGDTNDGSTGISVLPDGKILVTGYSSQNDGSQFNLAAARYNSDGSLDATFGGAAIDSLGGTVSYTENAPAISLDPSVVVYDPDLAALAGGAGDYAGASLTIEREGGAYAQDVFSALGNLSLSGGDVILSGVTVGSYANGAGQLEITFNDNATQVRVDEVLCDIGYANTSDAPPPSVVIEYSFDDGNNGSQGTGGALTATGTATVLITPVNDAPTGSVTIFGSPAAGQTLTASNTLADADGIGVITYQWLADGLAIGGATGSTLLLTNAFAGEAISVDASYTDAYGTHESVTSAPTAPVGGSFTGTSGNDLLVGAGGNDTLDGGLGQDTMQGGAGDDLYFVDDRKDVVVEGPNGGTDTVVASVSYTLSANVENLTLTGSDGLKAWGNDLDNSIVGNSAADMLWGGGGADTLTGGDGPDTFVYTSVSESGPTAWDVITDFSSEQHDHIDLSKIDADTLHAGNQPFKFIGTAQFSTTDATAQLRFDPATQMLYGSTNADAAPELVIQLLGVTSLGPGDLVL